MKVTESVIGSDERCASGAPDYFCKKLGKELLACVLTAVMGLERGVTFQVSIVSITPCLVHSHSGRRRLGYLDGPPALNAQPAGAKLWSRKTTKRVGRVGAAGGYGVREPRTH